MLKLSNPILPTQGLTEPAQPTGPDIPFVPPSAAPVLPIDDWMTWEWLNFNKSFIINLFGDWTQNLTDLWTYKMTKILQFSRQIFRNMSKRKENRLLCAGLTIGQRGQWPSLSTDCSSSSATHSRSQAGARLWQNVPETRRPESEVWPRNRAMSQQTGSGRY